MRDSAGALSSLAEAAKRNSQAHYVDLRVTSESRKLKEVGRSGFLKLQTGSLLAIDQKCDTRMEANVSEVLKLARLVFLQSMQLEVSCSTEGNRVDGENSSHQAEVKGQRAMAAELQCKVRWLRQKSDPMMIYICIYMVHGWYQIWFSLSLSFFLNLFCMVVWCDTNPPNSWVMSP